MLRAVLFDLDGTLLHLHTEEFMNEYFKAVSTAVAGVVEPGHFIRALLGSTRAMLENRDPGLTNEEVFWSDFRRRCDEDSMNKMQPLLEEFYNHRFNSLAGVVKPGGDARPVVEKVLALDLKIVLATNPVFPASAIRDRMNWAGVGDLPWHLVTSYENMHFCKPHPEYYLEIASRLELKPEQCLMVGNDVEKDILPAAAAGMYTYLVTDYLINEARAEHRADGSGGLSGLTGWVAGVTGRRYY